jgi:hypothetical protein
MLDLIEQFFKWADKVFNLSLIIMPIVFVLVSIVAGVDLLTGGKLLQKEKPIGSGYYYHENSECVQRAQLITDFDELLIYSDWYLENGFSPKDGVKLHAFNSLTLNPFKSVNIYNIDTLDNGLIYADIDQSFGKKGNRVRRGYVWYDYSKETPVDSVTKFCDLYLNIPWTNLYGPSSTPDPRDKW